MIVKTSMGTGLCYGIKTCAEIMFNKESWLKERGAGKSVQIQ